MVGSVAAAAAVAAAVAVEVAAAPAGLTVLVLVLLLVVVVILVVSVWVLMSVVVVAVLVLAVLVFMLVEAVLWVAVVSVEGARADSRLEAGVHLGMDKLLRLGGVCSGLAEARTRRTGWQISFRNIEKTMYRSTNVECI